MDWRPFEDDGVVLEVGASGELAELLASHIDGAYFSRRYGAGFPGVDWDDRGQVAAAYLSGVGEWHYDPHGEFHELGYLDENPDVAEVIGSGLFVSGFHHYLLHGQQEGRWTSPAPAVPEPAPEAEPQGISDADVIAELLASHIDGAYFSRRYGAGFPGVDWDDRGQVAAAYLSGVGEWHYDPHGEFHELGYLDENPDVAEVIGSGLFVSGFHHYLLHGQQEGRWTSPAPAVPAKDGPHEAIGSGQEALNSGHALPDSEPLSTAADAVEPTPAGNGSAPGALPSFSSCSGYDGFVERADGDGIAGWIASRGDAPDPARISLFHAERYVGMCDVSDVRPEAGPRAFGFSCDLPDRLKGGAPIELQMRIAGHYEDLLDTPIIVDMTAKLARADTTAELLDKGPRPPLAKTEIRKRAIKGNMDREENGVLIGWASFTDGTIDPVTIELVEGDRVVTKIEASVFRPDLLKRGYGEGRHGFEVDVANIFRDSRTHDIFLRVADTGDIVSKSAISFKSYGSDGIVRYPKYLDNNASMKLLNAPFEHYVYDVAVMDMKRAQRRLANRLKRERMLIGAADGTVNERPTAALVMLFGGSKAASTASAHLRLWEVQSDPDTLYATIGAPSDVKTYNAEICAANDVAKIREIIQRSEWCVFSRPGDAMHPSTAYVIRTLDNDINALSWNIFLPKSANAGDGGTLMRRSVPDRATTWHNPSLDTAFSVKTSLLADCPDDVLLAVGRGNIHLLLCWLDATGRARWSHHIEALTVRSAQEIEYCPPEQIVADIEIYRRLALEMLPDFSLEETRIGEEMPFVLLPARRAKRSSVIICYHNNAGMTLRSMHSISRQKLTGSLEVVLVNNRSDDAQRAMVVKGAVEMFGRDAVIALDYEKPFNHSAQNNIGVEAASGDVVFICNNDAFLHDETVLEQIGAWALQPGIGTVGCALENSVGGSGCFGHMAKPLGDQITAGVFGENKSRRFARTIHAVPGNTLAFAGMARDRFLACGELDAVRFPIGYNDVEFMLRASRHGLTHLYLGHLRAEHERGSSRSGDNEGLQLIWIRERYPDLLRERFSQFLEEPIQVSPVQVQTKADPRPGEIKTLLAKALATNIEAEGRRATIVLGLDEVESMIADAAGSDEEMRRRLLAVSERLAAIKSEALVQ